jgi:hypothetical protein
MMYRTRRCATVCGAVVALLAGAVSRTGAAQRSSVPAPESALRFAVGADFKLAAYEKSIRYVQRLAHPAALSKEFFFGGPILGVITDPSQPVMAGSPMLSGNLLGEKQLQGAAAALDVKQGRGHVALVGFRPQWRGQPFGTSGAFRDAAIVGRDVAVRAKGIPGFWGAK